MITSSQRYVRNDEAIKINWNFDIHLVKRYFNWFTMLQEIAQYIKPMIDPKKYELELTLELIKVSNLFMHPSKNSYVKVCVEVKLIKKGWLEKKYVGLWSRDIVVGGRCKNLYGSGGGSCAVVSKDEINVAIYDYVDKKLNDTLKTENEKKQKK